MVRSLSIRAKLTAAFFLLVLLSLGQALYAQRGVRAVDHDLEHVHDHTVPSVRWSGALSGAVAGARARLLTHLISSDEPGKGAAELDLQAVNTKIENARRELERLISNPDERQRYEEFSRSWET